MKVGELIEHLSRLPSNAEVKVWDAKLDDFKDVSRITNWPPDKAAHVYIWTDSVTGVVAMASPRS